MKWIVVVQFYTKQSDIRSGFTSQKLISYKGTRKNQRSKENDTKR